MREYKFRGKRIDNEEWIYGWLRQTGHQNIEKANGQYIETIKVYQIQDKDYYTEFVREETIGQYTGLHDKNGKEIYEGDIIEIDNETAKTFNIKNKGIVTYECGTYLVSANNDFQLINALYTLTNVENVVRGKIIGNIYDNSELLEVQTDLQKSVKQIYEDYQDIENMHFNLDKKVQNVIIYLKDTATKCYNDIRNENLSNREKSISRAVGSELVRILNKLEEKEGENK